MSRCWYGVEAKGRTLPLAPRLVKCPGELRDRYMTDLPTAARAAVRLSTILSGVTVVRVTPRAQLPDRIDVLDWGQVRREAEQSSHVG